eukprot:TRINITY_DN15197_c0_g1_i9.p1 TRINITY_DN15197_c0_g1~~TRINITY_DN15197_c0_g1_i9.p1  ORF type:complete len:907 (+),score=225.74 TRINITY_DN15197_c0_g1_i9:79-2721(+)
MAAPSRPGGGGGVAADAAAAGILLAPPPQHPPDPLRSLGRQRAAALALAGSLLDSRLRNVSFWRWRCWTLRRAALGSALAQSDAASTLGPTSAQAEGEEDDGDGSPGESGSAAPPLEELLSVVDLFPGVQIAQGTERFLDLANMLLNGQPVEGVVCYSHLKELMQLFDATHGDAAEPLGAHAPFAAPGSDSSGAAAADTGAEASVRGLIDSLPTDWADPTACPEIRVEAGRLPVAVVGDLHGQMNDLLDNVLLPVLRQDEPPTRLLFLGDYVDRGPCGLDVFCLLAMLRVMYPEHVTMLRGNHEDPQVTLQYGFATECAQKYPRPPPTWQPCPPDAVGSREPCVWQLVVRTFPGMPVAAVVRHSSGRAVFCTHGGLSPLLAAQGGPGPEYVIHRLSRKQHGRWRLRDALVYRCVQARDIAGTPPPATEMGIDGLLWSGPVDHPDGAETAPHFHESPRGCGATWTEAASVSFCQEHGFDFICRAHQQVRSGYLWQHSSRVLTVFSATDYCGAGNRAGVLPIGPEWWPEGDVPCCRTYSPPPSPPGSPSAPDPSSATPPQAYQEYFTPADGEEEECAEEECAEEGTEELLGGEELDEDDLESREYRWLHAAVTLQRWYRRWGAAPMLLAAEVMQRFARRCAARHELRRRRQASATLLCRRTELEQRGWAAGELQRVWRGAQERAARIRAGLGRADLSAKLDQFTAAAVHVQAAWRGHLARKAAQARRAAAAQRAAQHAALHRWKERSVDIPGRDLSKHLKKQVVKKQTRAWRLWRIRERAAAAAAQRAAPPAQAAGGALTLESDLPRDGAPFGPRPPRSLAVDLPVPANEVALEHAAAPAAAVGSCAAGPGGGADKDAPLGEQPREVSDHGRWCDADADCDL